MATRFESWKRLVEAAWLADPTVQRLMAAQGARPQRIADGQFSLLKDDYRIEILNSPPALAPEELVHEFADDPNRAVNNGKFNGITTFTRRPRGTPPAVGDFYLLQFFLLGFKLETGAIMTVLQSPNFGEQTSRLESWFVIQALETPEQGSMPEFGAREFGIERDGPRVFFYVRGASRSRDLGSAVFGKAPQQHLWLAAMQGIADRIRAAGGRAASAPERNHEASP